MISTPTEPRVMDAVTLQERLTSASPPRVLDVRSPAEFQSVHIPGAYNVPLDTLREHREELRHHLDEDVVLVCASGVRARQAEKALAEAGMPGLRVLEGGMSGWQAVGAPVSRGKQTWELERQIRFIAGSLVTASVLGSTVSPRLKWLAAGVGSGLVGAALTNTCAMGYLVSRAPWNRKGDPDVRTVFRALAEGE